MQNQKMDYLIYVGTTSNVPKVVLPLKVNSLSTYEVAKAKVSIDIIGSGFDTLNKIILERNGTIINTAAKTLSNLQDQWTASFDLTSVQEGDWTVKVINSISDTATVNRALKVVPTLKADIDFRLITTGLMREGRWRSVIVEVENKGNADAWFVPVYIMLSGKPEFEKNINNILRVYNLNDTLKNTDFSKIPGEWKKWDDVPPYFTAIDSLTGKEVTYLPLFFPIIKANEIKTFEFKIKYSGIQDYTIEIFADEGLIANEDQAFRSSDLKCLFSLGKLAVDMILPDIETCKKALNQMFVGIAAATVSRTIFKGKNTSSSVAGTLLDYLIPLATGFTVCASEFIPHAKFAKRAKKFMDVLRRGNTAKNDLQAVENACSTNKEKQPKKHEGKIISSMTPEDKFGIVGAEKSDNLPLAQRQNFVKGVERFEYRIDYWNRADATANAAEVFIKDTLDSKFDMTTFNFTEIGFLRWRVPLQGGHYFNVNVDMRPDYNYIVNVEGKVDPDTREVYWVHRTLDPNTLELPDDVAAGFLPPIDTQEYNVGWVKFDVKANRGLPSETVFKNQARVNFDGVGPWGPAPPYGPYVNTYDFDIPTSQVNSLVNQTTDTTFTVNWNGFDGDGCGIGTYDIYVRKNNGTDSLWLYQIRDNSANFTGKKGNTYCFYSVAYDKVGNAEAKPTSPDACISVTSPIATKDNLKVGYELSQNIPNPFSEETIIKFKIPTSTKVKLLIYDNLGHSEIVLDKEMNEGEYQVTWQPKQNGSAVYYYELVTPEFRKTKKMVFFIK